MAKNKEKFKGKTLWDDIIESDFLEEENIIIEDVAAYDKQAMTTFSQNVNLFRHLVRLQDSLKPVERRGMYAMYENGNLPDKKLQKSSKAVANTMMYHPHGDISIYKTLVGLAQPWKTPVPMVYGMGNFGSDVKTNTAAAMRYTEMKLSRYAYDCFFSDYDKDCVEILFNTAYDGNEPLALPAKYPNILVNGGFGIAVGNAFCIPSYNIADIVKLCKRLLRNPDTADIYILPDIATGCDIVDNGSLREICDTGKGVLKMRSTIDISEDPKKPGVWILTVRNIPWMTSIPSIKDKLVELTKNGILPIKDIHDRSYPITTKNGDGKFNRKIIQFEIIISKAHDPYAFRQKLYKLTELEKSQSVNFKVVEEALSVGKLNMRDLVLAWIDSRKEYKRRLLNKEIVKIGARISLLEILIALTSPGRLEKTIKVVGNSLEEELVENFMKLENMTSYQATEIKDMGFKAFTKDKHDKYVAELEKRRAKLDVLVDAIKSSKHLADEIDNELNDLLKYGTDRRSRIIEEESGVHISDTDHYITITKQGAIKKLPYDLNKMVAKKTPSLGAFRNNDYPTQGFVINNHDSMMLFDHLGRFSCIPVHTIESTEPDQYGSKIFDTTKLNGEIISAFQFFAEDTQDFVMRKLNCNVSVITLTKNGYLKKTPIDEFTKSRSQKNVKAMKVREDDSLISAMICMDNTETNTDMIIYTKKGNFVYINSDNIAVQSKDSMGLSSMKLIDGDECVGMCILGKDDSHLVVVTEKGFCKRCELEYLGESGKRRTAISYLATTDVNDAVYYVNGCKSDQEMIACTRTSYQVIPVNTIPVKTRKAKCDKMIPVPLGNNIISIDLK